jgi:hypothetical protein
MLGRTLIRLALLAGVLFLVAGRTDSERPAPRIPRPPTTGLPPEMAEIAGAGFRGSARTAPAAGPRPFADRGSRRQISRLRRDVARALRAASSPDDRVSVAAWHGVYVSGRRALALVDLRRATRSRRGLPFRRLPLARTRLELTRDRRWRIAGSPHALAVAGRPQMGR